MEKNYEQRKDAYPPFVISILDKLIQPHTRQKKPQETITYSNGDFTLEHTMAEGPSVSNVINESRRFLICLLLRANIISDNKAKQYLKKNIIDNIFIKNRAGTTDDDEDSADDNTNSKVKQLVNFLFKQIKNVETINGENILNQNRKTLYDRCVNSEIRTLLSNMGNGNILQENIYIALGIIIQHKTSADELQIHTTRILNDLFPKLTDADYISTQIYFLTFDQICGIIALYYGVPLFLQKGNGVAIGFKGSSKPQFNKNNSGLIL